MAQCEGTTKAGSRCRRQAGEGSPYCAAHAGESASSGERKEDTTFDLNETAKLILGVVLIGAIAYFFGGLRKPKFF